MAKGMKMWRVVAVAAVLAACGSSGTHAFLPTVTTGSLNAASPAAASAAAGHSATRAAAAGDELAVATSMVLQPSDLPADWKAADHQDAGTGQDRLDQQIGQCMGISRTIFSRADEAAEAHSPDFSLPAKNEQIVNAVKIEVSDAAANQAWQSLATPTFPSCLEQAFKNGLSSVTTAGGSAPNVSVQRLGFSSLLDRTSALRVTTAVSVAGFTVTVVTDYLFMQRGRVLAALTYTGGSSTAQPTPMDAGLEEHLAAVVAGRVSKANVR